MKVNIGCGYNRLEGWLNADSSPDSAADSLMQAWDLKLENACAAEVRALHLVEHLGFFRTKYFLSECWRALRPGGLLLLETPDIDAAFRIFLDGDHAAREAALGWIYGAETPGMGHAYCMPAELLRELLQESGFSVVNISRFMFQPHRPALRIEARKEESDHAALNSALRRRLLDRGITELAREEEKAGLEQAVRRLVRGEGNPGRELEQALVCAPAVMEYFALTEENDPHPSAEASACAVLAGWGLQARLAAAYRDACGRGLAHEPAYAAALSAGRAAAAAALAGRAPEGPSPAEAAPAVFTAASAAAWLFRAKAAAAARRA